MHTSMRVSDLVPTIMLLIVGIIFIFSIMIPYLLVCALNEQNDSLDGS